MTYNLPLTRTSMALDQATLEALDWLAKKWGTSKAGVVRSAVRTARQHEEKLDNEPLPLAALDWLQEGGGHTLQEAAEIKDAIYAERQAKRFWWES